MPERLGREGAGGGTRAILVELRVVLELDGPCNLRGEIYGGVCCTYPGRAVRWRRSGVQSLKGVKVLARVPEMIFLALLGHS